MNKRVLYVIDNLQTGGAEQVFADIAELMHGYVQFDVLFILPKKVEAYKLPDGVKAIYLNRKSKFSLSSMKQCADRMRSYEMIHVHLRHTFRYIAWVKSIFRLKVPILLHDHHGKIAIDKSAPFPEWKLLKPNYYIGVSQELTEWAINRWGIPRSKVATFINLISERFRKVDFRNRTGMGGLVMVGNIKKVKNQDFAVRIAEKLNSHIDIIGNVQDIEYYNSRKDLFQGTHCSVKSGILDVRADLYEAELGLYTALSESGPLVIIEYLTCGLPFLAFKTGGMAEIASEYFPEYFIDNFNEVEWVERIKLIRENHLNVSKVKEEEMLDKHFNPEVYRNRLLQIYAS